MRSEQADRIHRQGCKGNNEKEEKLVWVACMEHHGSLTQKIGLNCDLVAALTQHGLFSQTSDPPWDPGVMDGPWGSTPTFDEFMGQNVPDGTWK